MNDVDVPLADGRTLSCLTVGDATGPAVFYFHGAPTSRLDVAPLDDELRASGIRVIGIDRPGYGRSTLVEERRIEQWPQDVAQVADHFEIDTFGVIGMSSGGPYAVVAPALLPDRVTGAAVLAGVTDMGWSDAWDTYIAPDKNIGRLDQQAAIAWCEEHFGVDGMGYLTNDEAVPMSEPDRKVVSDPVRLGSLVQSIQECFRNGVAGYAVDMRAEAQPWQFDPRTIDVPVAVIHGAQDTFIAVDHSRHTAEMIPTATLTVWPDHGHVSLFDEMPAIIRRVVDAA